MIDTERIWWCQVKGYLSMTLCVIDQWERAFTLHSNSNRTIQYLEIYEATPWLVNMIGHAEFTNPECYIVRSFV